MRVSVIGTGYVGLVQGVMLAEFGLKVICMDVDEKKIESLNNGIAPIYEPGINELLNKHINNGRLQFSCNINHAIDDVDVIFIAVGTPSQDDGSADLNYVLNVAQSIGEQIKSYAVIVNKSTVPVGTGQLVKQTIRNKIVERNLEIEFDVVSNPEFLREGKAVSDCLNPDRIILGTENNKSLKIMQHIYDALHINQVPFVCTNIETAELIKYSANAFLAVKISFINEIALLAEKVGANIGDIAYGMGLDCRIAPYFLQCGPGYGGSCFPKDTRAIVEIANNNAEELLVVRAAITANEKQKQKMVEKICNVMSTVDNKTIGILGLTFKADTDDMRDAPSIDIINGLIKNGANIRVYCPQGMKEAQWRLEHHKKKITYCGDEYDVSNGASAIVLMTEWGQFISLDLSVLRKNMNDNVFFDLRNMFVDSDDIRTIFKYFAVGHN